MRSNTNEANYEITTIFTSIHICIACLDCLNTVPFLYALLWLWFECSKNISSIVSLCMTMHKISEPPYITASSEHIFPRYFVCRDRGFGGASAFPLWERRFGFRYGLTWKESVQLSAESRGFSPGAPVSSHRESWQGGLHNCVKVISLQANIGNT
jgi:hypothetical protein